MPTSDNPSETPWEPLGRRERVYLALVRFLSWLFRVDFFDVYRRQDVSYDERDEIHRIGMGPVSQLKNEWLEVYRRQEAFYDDMERDDRIPYAMWLVMRSDDTINPPTVISAERRDDGEWDVETSDEPPVNEKERRKKEILCEIDDTGFIDPVMEESCND